MMPTVALALADWKHDAASVLVNALPLARKD